MNKITFNVKCIVYNHEKQQFELITKTANAPADTPLVELAMYISHDVRDNAFGPCMSDNDMIIIAVGKPHSTCADSHWVAVGYHPKLAAIANLAVQWDDVPLVDMIDIVSPILSMNRSDMEDYCLSHEL